MKRNGIYSQFLNDVARLQIDNYLKFLVLLYYVRPVHMEHFLSKSLKTYKIACRYNFIWHFSLRQIRDLSKVTENKPNFNHFCYRQTRKLQKLIYASTVY